EAHRERDVALRFRLRFRGAELGQHGGGAERPAPGAEVFRAEAPHAAAQIAVHIARVEWAPAAVATIREHASAGRLHLPRDQANQFRIGDDLPLPDLAFPAIDEARDAVLHRHVRLAQGGDPERAVLAEISFTADAAERLADQPQH